MKILVLGHKGMLGRTVTRFYTEQTKHEVLTTNTRWGESSFAQSILDLAPDLIINCIGKIPQKQPVESEYTFLNIELPRFLETLDIPIIHPSTDCEFKGDLKPGMAYSKTSVRDADDIYGISKATISAEIESAFKNTKIIRTSIIGHEENTALSLLDWFLSQAGSTRGYTNHFWNGITTLEWAKQSASLIEDWDNTPTLNQLATPKHYSKFEILNIAKAVYQKDIEVIPFATETTVNKCLTSDREIPDLADQLVELKAFYNK